MFLLCFTRSPIVVNKFPFNYKIVWKTMYTTLTNITNCFFPNGNVLGWGADISSPFLYVYLNQTCLIPSRKKKYFHTNEETPSISNDLIILSYSTWTGCLQNNIQLSQEFVVQYRHNLPVNLQFSMYVPALKIFPLKALSRFQHYEDSYISVCFTSVFSVKNEILF